MTLGDTGDQVIKQRNLSAVGENEATIPREASQEGEGAWNSLGGCDGQMSSCHSDVSDASLDFVISSSNKLPCTGAGSNLVFITYNHKSKLIQRRTK